MTDNQDAETNIRAQRLSLAKAATEQRREQMTEAHDREVTDARKRHEAALLAARERFEEALVDAHQAHNDALDEIQAQRVRASLEIRNRVMVALGDNQDTGDLSDALDALPAGDVFWREAGDDLKY